MSDKKSKNEQLQEELFLNKKSAWLQLTRDDIFQFAEEYKEFMDNSKTERLCVKNIITALEKDGYKNIDNLKSVQKGDKVYKNVKERAILAAYVGEDTSKIQLIGSHLDSPRLDLKPQPVYEDSNFALLKTHYYGGIKKYHWVNEPLALHGVIFTKNGKKVEISFGEENDEPKLIIPDLLPHLAQKQMEKKPSEIIEGEELNLLVGNIPVNDDKIKEQMKLNVLKILNQKYGIVEEDFIAADLELVPAKKGTDIGFDKSMIAAYGQDDKVCAYTSLRALLDIKKPKHIAVSLFADKEEIGSMGDTGAASFILSNFAADLVKLLSIEISAQKLLENSYSISADVTAGVDPNHKDVHDLHNASFLGKGISVEKYGGAGGKYSSNDASAEFMNYIRNLLESKKIPWQTGEIGKIDLGGGGTIAMYLSRYGMDCVDAGPAVLGMHSPCEVSSKVDIYASYLFYKEFFED